MIQVEFVPSGSDMNQAMVSTCELTSKIFLKKNTELNFKYIDIRCLSAEDAESLDELMWSIPQNALIPHKLVHNQNNNYIQKYSVYFFYTYLVIFHQLNFY